MGLRSTLAGLFVVCLLVSPALGQDEGGAAQMSEEQQQEMMAWMKAATPGPNHETLSYMVGKWETHSKAMMSPDAEPMESVGECENKWVLGGRFVQTSYRGDFMGSSFEGIGYTGFDNIKGKYTSAWMDTMGTMIMTEEGEYDAGSKTFTYTSSFKDPMGKTVNSKSKVEVTGKDEHVMTMSHKKEGDKEHTTMMVIRFVRKTESAKAPAGDME